MRRKNEQSIGEVLKDFFKTYGLERKYAQAEVGHVWGKLLGPSVANATQKVTLNNGLLTVYLQSGLVKQELNMMKTRLISALNEELGGEVVKELKLI